MTAPDMSNLMVSISGLSELLLAGDHERASALAARQLALSLADMALADAAAGRIEDAAQRMQDALNLYPDTRQAFHNMVAVLLRHKSLRQENLDSLQRFIKRRWDELPWVREYRRLRYMPRFLNVQFVAGRCNLNCRMCIGARGREAVRELKFVSTSQFQCMLANAPTANGITFSSGDSDPLLHPEIEQIAAIAREYQVTLDMFTNGQALTPRICRALVDSGAMQMINFSIDAATPETYRKVRGGNFERLIGKIEMLQDMKRRGGHQRPWISTSFVAMADTIHELPDYVLLANRLGSGRVYVEDLIGWYDDPCGNYPAKDNPRCGEYIREAQQRAVSAGINLQLPRGLRDAGAAEASETTHPVCETNSTKTMPHCGWLNGVQVGIEGGMSPCCVIHNVADLGNLLDGPLLDNDKYARVKELLLAGKVFKRCVRQRNCEYVQQQLAAGKRLQIITREELGDLAPAHDADENPVATADEVVNVNTATKEPLLTQ
ncbi:MAG: radical SAM protein [Planctomycetota bacterium]